MVGHQCLPGPPYDIAKSIIEQLHHPQTQQSKREQQLGRNDYRLIENGHFCDSRKVVKQWKSLFANPGTTDGIAISNSRNQRILNRLLPTGNFIDITNIRLAKRVLFLGNAYLRQIYESIPYIYPDAINDIKRPKNKFNERNYDATHHDMTSCVLHTKNCNLQLSSIQFKNHLQLYGSFVDVVNIDFIRNDPQRLLNYLDVKMEEIDMIVINDIFSSHLPSDGEEGNVMKLLQLFCNDLKYRGRMIALSHSFDFNLPKEIPLALQGCSIEGVNLFDLLPNGRGCSFPDCGDDMQSLQCLPGPTFDISNLLLEQVYRDQ